MMYVKLHNRLRAGPLPHPPPQPSATDSLERGGGGGIVLEGGEASAFSSPGR